MCEGFEFVEDGKGEGREGREESWGGNGRVGQGSFGLGSGGGTLMAG